MWRDNARGAASSWCRHSTRFLKRHGMFKGNVVNVQVVRRRDIYQVEYEDGDSEDFDLDEYRYVFELRQAIDTGVDDYVRSDEELAVASEAGTPEPKKEDDNNVPNETLTSHH
jgi:hypothetical protein